MPPLFSSFPKLDGALYKGFILAAGIELVKYMLVAEPNEGMGIRGQHVAINLD